MKNHKQFFVQVGKRFGTFAMLPILGFIGGMSLLAGTLLLWVLGFVVIPIGLLQVRLTKKPDPKDEDPALPRWASWWDDSLDLDVRGRPQASLVWTYGLSWPVATFVHLQFYNPLANIRTKFVAFHKSKTGRI